MKLLLVRVGIAAVVWVSGLVALSASVAKARADGIDPGLWQVTTQSKAEGMVSPPHESTKCLTEDETKDLATTFSPVPRMINSECAPIERKLDGGRLDWHLVCKGQLNVELTGAFNFDSARHYTAMVRTHATIGDQVMDTLDMLEGRWVSACQ
jgi:Protein of unknown function (DUF3617)